MNISGCTAIITGASSGIGAATARALAAKGARVVLIARDQQRLEAVASAIQQSNGQVQIYPADLSDAAAVAAVASTILDGVGAPNILINNAGAGRWLSVLETSAKDVEEMMAVPYFAAFNLTRELLPAMKRRGSGCIVNVTSVASRLTWPGATAYIAARRAMDGFDQGLRLELAGSGIRVMLAMFGSIETAYWANNPGSRERLPRITSLTPTLTEEQVAAAIVSGIEANRRLVLKPSIFRFVLGLNALFPRTTERLMLWGWRPPV
ncbi:MAG: SDR family NAD(P)-dependent oxidoreductase [Rhizobiales bacterium]|nr:SDR family NAD(P)-dependent oxidoreductase [Hyphomicrobiales bacterium]